MSKLVKFFVGRGWSMHVKRFDSEGSRISDWVVWLHREFSPEELVDTVREDLSATCRPASTRFPFRLMMPGVRGTWVLREGFRMVRGEDAVPCALLPNEHEFEKELTS